MMKHTTYTKILIIDRSRRYAHNIAQQLKSSWLQHSAFPEYEVKVASTGLEALLISHEFQADCVLLNYELPDMSGVDFLDSLEDIRGGMAVPFLLLVEQGNETAVASLKKHNIDNFLIKGEFDALQLTWTICSILERAKLQAQLYRKHEELKIFADRMAHDLLVSLSKLSLCTEYLEMHTDADAIQNTEHSYALSAIVESIDQTINLVESFRDYAHVEHMNVNFSKVNLNSIMDHILLELKPEIDLAGTQIFVEPLPIVVGDPDGLGQLLHSLIVNAMKYGNDSRSIRVQTTRRDTAWQISITADGIAKSEYNTYSHNIATESEGGVHGMHRNRGQNIEGTDLEKGASLPNCSKDPDAEIKLAICRKIVELHGGTIESRLLPNGSTICCFTIEKNLKTSNRREPKNAFDDIALSNHHYSIADTQLPKAIDVC